jgi:hypothetical protein
MRVALLLVLSGCDALAFLGEQHQRVIDAQSDVAPDALVPACTGITSLLCADFEQPDIEYFSDGATYTVTQPGGMVTLDKVDPGNIGKGLRFDSSGGMYFFDANDTATAITNVEVRAYVRFDRVTTFTNQSALLVAGVGTNDALYTSCYAAIQLEPSGGRRLYMQHYCGGNDGFAILSTFPSSWVKLSLVLDLTQQIAAAYMNDTLAGTVPLGPLVKMGDQPFAHVGLEGAIDAAVAFDDVVATAHQ